MHNLFCEKGDQRLHGFTTAGHFAEYSISDYRNAMVLPHGMDLVSAAPLFCAGVTGQSLRASGNQDFNFFMIANLSCSLPFSQEMRIERRGLGCNYWLWRIGSLWYVIRHLARQSPRTENNRKKAIQYAKKMKLRVIAIDIANAQLEAAIKLGADLAFNSASNPDYLEKIVEKTGGAHSAIVLSASNAAYESAPKVLRYECAFLSEAGFADSSSGSMDFSWLLGFRSPTSLSMHSIFFWENIASWELAVAHRSRCGNQSSSVISMASRHTLQLSMILGTYTK